MKKRITFFLLITSCVLVVAQKPMKSNVKTKAKPSNSVSVKAIATPPPTPAPPQVILPQDKNYTFLSPFYKINDSREEIYSMAIAKNHNNRYALILEHKLVDFSYRLMNTTGITLTLCLKTPREKPYYKYTPYQEDEIPLKQSSINPDTVANTVRVAFDLPDSIVYDIKGKSMDSPKIKFVTYTSTGAESVFETSISRTLFSEGKNLFVDYASKLTSDKGSFDLIEPYKENPIPFYSLLHQKRSVIESRLGKPILEDTVVGGLIQNVGKPRVSYLTKDGKYIIDYDNDSTLFEMSFYPVKHFQFIDEQFFILGYPLEMEKVNEEECTLKLSSYSDRLFDETYYYKNGLKCDVIFYSKARYWDYVSLTVTKKK